MNAQQPPNGFSLSQFVLSVVWPAVMDQGKELEEIRREQLTPDKVAALVAQALEKKEARGWTTRERFMGLILFLLTLLTSAATLVNLFLRFQ